MKTRFILGSALAAVLLMWGGTGKVMAQKNIDKMAAELEKRDDVAINSVTKRDPKTRKVVKVVKSFSLKDENIGARLIEAFEKDEEYAETAIKDMPKGRGKAQKANFTFIYKTDNEKRTYTLNVKESGSVSMTVIISPMKDGQEVGSVVLDPEYWDSFNEQMAELGNNLRDSGIEVRQMSREEMEGIIDKENERVRRFFALLDDMEKKVERLARDNRPPFNGERFLTDRELSGMLKISRRCLQDYRDQGRIPYIQLGGKILYRQSDIERLLEENYHPALV